MRVCVCAIILRALNFDIHTHKDANTRPLGHTLDSAAVASKHFAHYVMLFPNSCGNRIIRKPSAGILYKGL